MKERVFALCHIDKVIDQPQNAPKGKAYLRLIFDDQQGEPVIVCVTCNVAMMIGGFGKGVDDLHNKPITWVEPKDG